MKTGRFVACNWLVLSPEHLPIPNPCAPIVRNLRGVFLMRKPLLGQETYAGTPKSGGPAACCVTAHLPPWTAGIRNVHTVHVLQVDSTTNACPVGYFLVHILTSDAGRCHDMRRSACVIRRTLRLLLCVAGLQTNENDVVWSAYFHRHVCTLNHASNIGDLECTDNIIMCDPPKTGSLHFSSICHAAELAFDVILPGEGTVHLLYIVMLGSVSACM